MATVDAGERILATVNFVRATVVNKGEARYCYRAKFLTPFVLKHERHCADCGRVIAAGETCALEMVNLVFCMGCVAWMKEADACQTASEKVCEPAEAARLRGERYGVFSAAIYGHAVSVADGGRG